MLMEFLHTIQNPYQAIVACMLIFGIVATFIAAIKS